MKGQTKTKASPREGKAEPAPAGFGPTIHTIMEQYKAAGEWYPENQMKLLTLRIENEKLLEMQKQTRIMQASHDYHVEQIQLLKESHDKLNNEFREVMDKLK